MEILSASGENVIEESIFRMIGDNYESAIIMPDKDDLKCPILLEEWPNLGYERCFTIDGPTLESVRRTFRYLGAENVPVSVKDGIFSIQIGEGTQHKGIVKAEVDYGNASAVYCCTVINFMKAIKGTVEVAFKDDSPLIIIQEDDNSRIQWIVSPVL